VPSFGALTAQLLVVGLAPGVRGANRTGRPFTGDYAGHLLYTTLLKFGFAKGSYGERPDDGLTLVNCRITNAVRCVPPQNLPTPAEDKLCNPFLAAEIAAMPDLRAILSLGTVSHLMTLRALGVKPGAHKFAHGAKHAPRPGSLQYEHKTFGYANVRGCDGEHPAGDSAIAFFGPWIRIIVIAAGFPETGIVAFSEFQPLHPFG
jgi:uracil-DNA glycosylase family 4